MSNSCKCGQTKCLSCIGTCPNCGDDIMDHFPFDEYVDRRLRLAELTEKEQRRRFWRD